MILTLCTNLYTRLIRIGSRSVLIQDGPQTCSDLAFAMGIDPRKHKGTLHSILVDLEKQGVLSATRNEKTGKRDLWFIHTDKIRNRDRILAAIL